MLTHCFVPYYLAYAMAAYTMASILYISFTRNIGTPLKDSYTKEQLAIKKKSASKRRKIFYTSLLGAVILLIVTKPFHKCMNISKMN